MLFSRKFKTYPEALTENGYFVGYTAKGWAPGVPGKINGKERQLTGQPFDARKIEPPATGSVTVTMPVILRISFLPGLMINRSVSGMDAGSRTGGMSLDQGLIREAKNFPTWMRFFHSGRTTKRFGPICWTMPTRWNILISTCRECWTCWNPPENWRIPWLIVTADNGMPFPRIKGQEYEYSNHLPLAVMWADGIKNPGRQVDDFISFIDFAPTILELAGITPDEAGLQPVQGKSLVPLFQSGKSGTVEEGRDYVLIGKERHDIGRPEDQGYPIRGIVTSEFLYVKNFEPERWPAGNPETGYLNCDGSPTKTVCLDARDNPETKKYWEMSFGKRPPEELYNIREDKDCMNNLAEEILNIPAR